MAQTEAAAAEAEASEETEAAEAVAASRKRQPTQPPSQSGQLSEAAPREGRLGGEQSGQALRAPNEEAAGRARDVEEEEQARREWLEYYLQTGEWRQAEELVVSADEQERLDHLRRLADGGDQHL